MGTLREILKDKFVRGYLAFIVIIGAIIAAGLYFSDRQ